MNTPDIAIAVDVMGGDYAPDAIMDGVAEVFERFGDAYKLFLVGDQVRIHEGLERLGISEDDVRLEIVHAAEVIGMDEHPVKAIREKRKSSINMAMDLVKNGQAQGVFSAGSTGAAVGSAFLKWRMLPGLARPGLATLLPKETGGHWVLMDSGATVDCTPTYLAQFAVMGDLYARHMLHLKNPTIGLLSNGTEVGKGNRQTQDAFRLIREIPGINFVGNIEGTTVFSGDVDVVVSDGFTGNVLLKATEGVIKYMMKALKGVFYKSTPNKLAAAVLKKDLTAMKKTMDVNEVGGTALVGISKPVIKAHGSSNAASFFAAIRQAKIFAESGIIEDIKENIEYMKIRAEKSE